MLNYPSAPITVATPAGFSFPSIITLDEKVKIYVCVSALAEKTAKAVARIQGERLLRKGAERLLNRYLNK